MRCLWAGLWAVVAVAMLSCGGTTGTKDGAAETKKEEPAVAVTLQELGKAYYKNAVAADDAYKGKTLLLTGEVSVISELKDGRIRVWLSADKHLYKASCYFQAEHRGEVVKLTSGQVVTVRGHYVSRELNAPKLENCNIVP